jgi:hypothetical protein
MRLAIGDIHGRPYWKHYLVGDYGAFYFCGDYFDTHNPSVSFKTQYQNFTAICEAARKDSRLKLCIGNHDYHYLKGVEGEQYSSYQFEHAKKIGAALEEQMDLLNIVYDAGGGWLVSHAGVTNWFFKSLKNSSGKPLAKPEEINDAFRKDRTILIFNGVDFYGDDITQGPLWVRPASLLSDALAGYSQIVGHTPMKKISEVPIPDTENKVVFIDTYDTESIYRF